MSELPSIPPGSNVMGVGIDQIEIARISDSLDKHGAHFLDKIFTPSEQAYCRDKADPVPHLAARFAAKEAASKAFGTGFGEKFGWLDSEVQNDEQGQPILRFSEKGAALLNEKGASSALVSLTHLESIASSIVVLVSSS